MILLRYCAAAAAVILALPSCQTVTVADHPALGRTAMKFDGRGASALECGLVSQVEKGRHLSSTSSGGGCSSCH